MIIWGVINFVFSVYWLLLAAGVLSVQDPRQDPRLMYAASAFVGVTVALLCFEFKK